MSHIYLDLLQNFEPDAYNDFRPRVFHNAATPFEELANDQFIKIFRLSKERVLHLIDIVSQYMPAPGRRTALNIRTMVFAALRFFATGSYQLDIGMNRFLAIGQSSICDADCRILNVNARFPGSANDCGIWNNSTVQPLMRRLHNYGDAGYPLRPWLMTPIKDPSDDFPESAYNKVFCRARSTIERVNGILKMRFRCLLKHRVFHYNPTTAAKIVNTWAILHNMAIMDGFEFPAGENETYQDNEDYGMFDDEELDEDNVLRGHVNPELEAGRNVRRRIVRRWFT